MNKLSIIVLFCDKDYKYIPSLLKQMNDKLCCWFEVILVDNREKYKDIEIKEIEDFKSVNNLIYIDSGKNVAQLAAKKNALEYAKGDYVWFFDADDEMCDCISQTFLDKCDSDFIIFNYGFKEPGVYIKDDRIIYKECTDEYKTIYNKSKFRDADFLNENCCTAWNKWIKREIVNQIFIPVKKDKKVSCNEDVYLCSAALNKSKSVQLMPHYIYMNRPDRGNSNNFIDSFENFEKVIQGWKESLDLFKYEFPKSCNLFDYEEKRKSDIAYFLNRYYNCDDSIKEKVINRILEVCTKKEILNVLNERYSGFLENALTDEEYKTLKNEITKYLS